MAAGYPGLFIHSLDLIYFAVFLPLHVRYAPVRPQKCKELMNVPAVGKSCSPCGETSIYPHIYVYMLKQLITVSLRTFRFNKSCWLALYEDPWLRIESFALLMQVFHKSEPRISAKSAIIKFLIRSKKRLGSVFNFKPYTTIVKIIIQLNHDLNIFHIICSPWLYAYNHVTHFLLLEMTIIISMPKGNSIYIRVFRDKWLMITLKIIA